MKKLLMLGLAAAALAACDSDNNTGTAISAVDSGLPEKAELLASNTVLTQYTQTIDQPCRMMTALCPDRCNHATRLAQFLVLGNEDYSRPGKYGDEKIMPGETASIDVQKPVLGQSPEVAQRISALKPGELVRLTINHYYVQQGQGQFPVRPVVRFETVKP